MKIIITMIISLMTISIADVKIGWIELSTVVTQLDDFRQAQVEQKTNKENGKQKCKICKLS